MIIFLILFSILAAIFWFIVYMIVPLFILSGIVWMLWRAGKWLKNV